MKNNDLAALNLCLKSIEKKLAWGSSENWHTYDFERLSEQIFSETKINLSSNTLKRIWGRINYDSNPSISTLNTLARFLGYKDWRDYLLKNRGLSNSKPKDLVKKVHKSYILWFLAILLLPTGFWSLNNLMRDNSDPQSSLYEFRSKRISNSLPNSVIFYYNAKAAKENDVVEVQQSWDSTKRTVVSSRDTIATSLYYHPGYFDAKLVVNDRIVKQHGLLIPSNGWLGLIDVSPEPVYLNNKDLFNPDGITISAEHLRDFSTQNLNNIWSYLYYVDDFEDLTLDDFSMEVTLKSGDIQGINLCNKVSVKIFSEDELIVIPLSIKGCVSDLEFRFLDQKLSGKSNDLSKFSIIKNESTKLKCYSVGGTFHIYINDQPVYSHPIGDRKLKIMGVRFGFKPSGAIEALTLSSSKRVYLDERMTSNKNEGILKEAKY